jgi:phosphate transport system substrate-binding protein
LGTTNEEMFMKKTTHFLSCLGLCFLSLSLFARPTVRVDGSSTVFPITEAVAEEFQKEQKGKVLVTVGISGTGGGFKKFCRGETDLQNASRPISAGESADCRANNIGYIELPVAYDAITIIISARNTWLADITLEELKKIWEPAAHGKITNWQQIRPEWPNQRIRLYGAGADSGTFDYFTEAVMGKARASRSDFTSSEDDNTLVQGVAQDEYALGFIPFSYYEHNTDKLKAVPLKVESGAALPSHESIADGSYVPFSRPVFIYVSTNAAQKPEVDLFTKYYLKNVPKLAPQAANVALPAKLYDIVEKKYTDRKTGSIYGNAHATEKLEALLQK